MLWIEDPFFCFCVLIFIVSFLVSLLIMLYCCLFRPKTVLRRHLIQRSSCHSLPSSHHDRLLSRQSSIRASKKIKAKNNNNYVTKKSLNNINLENQADRTFTKTLSKTTITMHSKTFLISRLNDRMLRE